MAVRVTLSAARRCFGTLLLGGALCAAWPALALSPALRFVGADGRALDRARDTLSISRRITHDASLPRADTRVSEDPGNFRLEALVPGSAADVLYAWLESRGPAGRRGLLRHVPLRRVPGSSSFRSSWLRLVVDETDLSAPDVGGLLLWARLRDTVRAGLGSGPGAPTSTMRVGGGSRDGTSQPVLTGTLRVIVLRTSDGVPVVGDDDADALILAREQVEIANEVWAQCGIEFGAAEAASVLLSHPPPAALIAVADEDGFPALGDAAHRLIVGTTRLRPVRTMHGETPLQTAQRLAQAIEAAGFHATVSENPRTGNGAYGSADVAVRDGRQRPVSVALAPDSHPDSRQRLQIGRVDLSDGLREFDNTVAPAGTLEERTLIKLLGDNDPRTIDLFVINHFAAPSRQGEAFIEADGSPLANTVLIDRNAIRYQRHAWVSAHELGHVLLDDALHPDNVGADRPWLLMDADARQGRVGGPKRLSDEECSRARRRSGPEAQPRLLRAL